MVQWLLSGHNPQETIGVAYPLTSSYIAEFMTNRQVGYNIAVLVGGTDQLDLSIPLMIVLQGRTFLNVFYFTRNVSMVGLFDPASIGVPKELVASESKPHLPTLLMLPWRFQRFYRQMMRLYRQVIPVYRKKLHETYWQLQACHPDQPSAEDLPQINRLFEPSTLEGEVVFSRMLTFVGLLNIGLLRWVNQKAPALLNLLVGQGTSTALLGERIWKLGRIALQCGTETVALLRQGETDLTKYRDIPEAKPLLGEIERFVRTYGHRAFHYASEFEAARLANQPELVLLTIGGLLEESESPTTRAAAARQVGYQALQGMNPFRRLFWKYLLAWGSKLVEKREECRDIVELQNATFGLAARLLSRYHFPDQPDDTLWLYTFDEFLGFGQSNGQKRVDPKVIKQRRAKLEQDRQQEPLPDLIWYDPETEEWWPVQENEKEQSGEAKLRLEGIGASPGSGPVEGIALVTNSAQEAAERLLELTGPVVLVTHVTDPLWTSLFRRLAAVVTEIGGAISHAAIVARENGIPAVVGASEATRLIPDGQRVCVDGSTGTVEVLQTVVDHSTPPSSMRSSSIEYCEVPHDSRDD